VAQVSTNVEDHRATPLAAVVAAIARHAEPSEAELVGLAPRAAFDGFPRELRVRGKRLIEDALAVEAPEREPAAKGTASPSDLTGNEKPADR
jgi:hypothetical protein